MRRQDFEALCRRLNVKDMPEDLLDQALTHSSVVYEQKLSPQCCNERLEYLGDAVLELCVTELLFRAFPRASEGELTRMRAALVCEESLAALANDLGLGALLKLGHGERRSGGAQKSAILEDAAEAVFGAIFLAQGYERVCGVIEDVLLPRVNLSCPPEQPAHQWKSKLQEYMQRTGPANIVYHSNWSGEPHKPLFFAEVWIDGKKLGEGRGGSKREAEQAAARVALEQMQSEA